MRVGSLCTGIAGLELGLQMAGINTEPVFVSDIDKGANEWLAANMADVPNLGDFTALDELPEVDIITAGFPCQPVSTAGRRAGINDERWLFDDITRLTSRMESRPLLFVENVPGLLTANGSDAMARVVYGLASIGYHITWGTLPAAAVGAPHRRNRWWGLAYPADSDSESTGRHAGTVLRTQEPRRGLSDNTNRPTHGSGTRTTPDADITSSEARLDTGHWGERVRAQPLGHPTSTADADDARRSEHGRTVPARTELSPIERPCPNPERFGQWAPAVAQWETILGRRAPDPTDGNRLNPAFVEWMMGYPAGWVTDTLERRTLSLYALGNAVVPQCAAQAFTQLTTRLPWT
mgnify:CR=1 FL=1